MHVEIAHASNRSKFRCSRLLQKFSILLLKAQRPSVLNSQFFIGLLGRRSGRLRGCVVLRKRGVRQ